jgi:hypothetical protein
MKYLNGKRIPPKVNASLRLSAQLKDATHEDAKRKGMNPSEYYEMLITNSFAYKEEISMLITQLSEKESSLAILNSQSVVQKNTLLREIEKLQQQNTTLKNELAYLKNDGAVLMEIYLLQIFEKVKGEEVSIKRADGTKFQITIKTLKDLLLVMIYSFKYKPK